MCGICGILDYSASNKKIVNEAVISNMCSSMKHRGPDDEGIYINKAYPTIGLGHRRLSIIDLSPLGHQPMSNEDGAIFIILNGEIYNYKELKVDLESKGHRFKSQTDTECIIHLYEEYREDCVKYLRGMFAFAIWDETSKTLLLARDRVGKKPLLYYQGLDVFCFASEFKALLESRLIEININYEAIDYYLSFGYIPAPLTIYKNVWKLLPAHTLILNDKEIRIQRYWDLDYSNKLSISEEEAARQTLAMLKDAVNVRLYSDVPLGAFLSGGIDSSTIVALMTKLTSEKVKTFSIGFDDSDYDELKYARNIAKHFNTEHNEFIVRPKALEILPLLVERYGEPYADSSCIPTYYVSQQTKKFVTVALNGDGGDELFAGYERYQAMIASYIYSRMPGVSRSVINGLSRLLPDSINSKDRLRRIKRFFSAANLQTLNRYTKWVSIFDEPLKKEIYSEAFQKEISHNNTSDLIKPFLSSFDERDILDALLYTDTMTYLPNDLLVKVDIASMANSLEARSPFLDHKLMEFVARLPSNYKMKAFKKKYILKKAINNILPQANIKRRKMGFGVPVGKWFRNELKGFLCETLLSEVSLNRAYFRPDVVRGMVKQHIESKSDYSFQLWTLLMLELWHKKFMN